MERIIQHNKDDAAMKYIAVSLFSLLTFKKLEKVERLKQELKEQMEDESDKL